MGIQKLETMTAGWYGKTPKMSESSRKASPNWWLRASSLASGAGSTGTPG